MEEEATRELGAEIVRGVTEVSTSEHLATLLRARLPGCRVSLYLVLTADLMLNIDGLQAEGPRRQELQPRRAAALANLCVAVGNIMSSRQQGEQQQGDQLQQQETAVAAPLFFHLRPERVLAQVLAASDEDLLLDAMDACARTSPFGCIGALGVAWPAGDLSSTTHG